MKQRIIAPWNEAERELLAMHPIFWAPLYRLNGVIFTTADGHGYPCTPTPVAGLWTPRGYIFDGDNVIDCGADTNLNVTPAITILCCVYRDPATCPEYATIVSKGATGVGNYWMSVRESTGLYEFACYDGTYQNHWSARTVPKSTWVHLAGVHDGTNVSLYQGGVLDSIQARLGNLLTNTQTLKIGYFFNATHWWLGNISDIIIFNRALTPLGIQGCYLNARRRMPWL